jgi:hypothetical protein
MVMKVQGQFKVRLQGKDLGILVQFWAKAIELMGKKYEKAESFKYLGSVMTSLAVNNKCYYALGPILKRRSISQTVKICLYKMIIRPTVIYGAETWTVTSEIEKMLMT